MDNIDKEVLKELIVNARQSQSALNNGDDNIPFYELLELNQTLFTDVIDELAEIVKNTKSNYKRKMNHAN